MTKINSNLITLLQLRLTRNEHGNEQIQGRNMPKVQKHYQNHRVGAFWRYDKQEIATNVPVHTVHTFFNKAKNHTPQSQLQPKH